MCRWDRPTRHESQRGPPASKSAAAAHGHPGTWETYCLHFKAGCPQTLAGPACGKSPARAGESFEHPQVLADTEALESRNPSTAAPKAAEGRITRGGVYSVGALSLVVKEAADEALFVVLTAEGDLRDERAGRHSAAVRVAQAIPGTTRPPAAQQSAIARSLLTRPRSAAQAEALRWHAQVLIFDP
jgi:hypothetical protein